MEDLIGLLFFAGFVGVAYVIGKHIEQSHYKNIEREESALLSLPVVSARKVVDDNEVADAKLVCGNVVVSGDYFKKILASLINLFGGRVVGYESLIDRARREAIIRMKKSAKAFGADIVLNARFETNKLDSMVNNNQGTGMFEIIAYGTAVKLNRNG